ncbi:MULTISPECIES: hypothetical protein [unclassified Sphingobacterium]|uniref:hypothetical protein n=1 Tax=unclassified Sphingobacterium TaxID=2609468 RepID=UPI0010F330E4|nr:MULTISPECIES: hypothetical protein [unclassified Sphingobacterium]MCS3556195.1 hypothetical protein [Sphingobacterium sp. JUb21]TCR08570.1 hypothetical protein EDF66_103117 [Sphingobacterium sp. JUb20]
MKKLTILVFLLSMTTIVFGQEAANTTVKAITQSGVGLGSIIAVVTSWDRNRSLGYAILHGIFSWFYVIFFAITDKDNRLRKMDNK